MWGWEQGCRERLPTGQGVGGAPLAWLGAQVGAGLGALPLGLKVVPVPTAAAVNELLALLAGRVVEEADEERLAVPADRGQVAEVWAVPRAEVSRGQGSRGERSGSPWHRTPPCPEPGLHPPPQETTSLIPGTGRAQGWHLTPPLTETPTHCWPSPSTGCWHVWPHLPGQHLVAPGQSESPAQWEQEAFLWHELQSWSRGLSTSEMW